MKDEHYASSEAARICGVSLRQLQWWDECGIVSPRQAGHRRLYVREELLSIMVVADLRRRHVPLQQTHDIARSLRRGMGRRLREILESREPDVFLLSDGATACYLESAPAGVVRRLLQCQRPMYLVDVSRQAGALLRATSRQDRSRTSSHSQVPAMAARATDTGINA